MVDIDNLYLADTEWVFWKIECLMNIKKALLKKTVNFK